MKYETKVQATGGTLSTSIPKTIRDMLNIDKGDILVWEVNIDEARTTVTIKKSE